LAGKNPWRNLFDPPVAHSKSVSDDAVLTYVRQSNYFDPEGRIALATALEAPPASWDGNGNGKWDGYVPDAWFSFDDRGFDHRPDGSLTGWRAFAYFPLPGAFLPTNGGFDDTLVRLDPALRQDEKGQADTRVYEINLAIVEALIRRADVSIDPTDEAALGVDLDLDGRMSRATRVAFDSAVGPQGETRMHYVGLARLKQQRHELQLAPGLFPTGTEFFHTLRYLDVAQDGSVVMATRMKEIRYARKTRWASYPIARANAIRETREQDESPDGIHEVRWAPETGDFTDHGWLLQGFIEDEKGDLRPQSQEETAYCEGCHGGIGGTTDGTFAFARKLSGSRAPARGWYHSSQHDWHGVREPKRVDGQYEYTFYLTQAGGADDRRENAEALAQFFDERGELRPAALTQLHEDVSTLFIPSRGRALALDRATMALVAAQSFIHGRDPILAPSAGAFDTVPLGHKTGVTSSVVQVALVQ
jgi:hypothetical protein